MVQIIVCGEEQRWLQLLLFLFSSLNSKIFVSFWLVLSVLGRAAVFRTPVLRYSLNQHLFLLEYLLPGFFSLQWLFVSSFFPFFQMAFLTFLLWCLSKQQQKAWEMGFSTSYIMCLGFMPDESFDSWGNNLGRLLMNLFEIMHCQLKIVLPLCTNQTGTSISPQWERILCVLPKALQTKIIPKLGDQHQPFFPGRLR